MFLQTLVSNTSTLRGLIIHSSLEKTFQREFRRNLNNKLKILLVEETTPAAPDAIEVKPEEPAAEEQAAEEAPEEPAKAASPEPEKAASPEPEKAASPEPAKEESPEPAEEAPKEDLPAPAEEAPAEEAVP